MSGTTKRRRNRGRRMVITRSTLKPTKQRQTSKVRSLSDLYPLTTNETVSEDSNTALTLQTLNADGTPKRPMNAFMIFARRRRPQVSAENQAMRTGEISKILSKEWVAMPPVIADNYRLSFLSYAFGSPKSNFTSSRRSSSRRRSIHGTQTTFIDADRTTRESADVRTRASCDRQSRHFSVSLGMTLVAWTWKFPLSMATNRSNSRHYRHRMPGPLTLCRSPRLITANLVRTRVALVIRCPWNLRFDQTANMSRVCRSAAPANLNEWHRVLSVRTPLLVCP